MAEKTKVKVSVRTQKGKGAARRLRRSGEVPAIAYGHGLENTMLSIPPEAMHTVSTAHGLVELQFDGATTPVLVRNLQWDHLKGVVIHVDFQVVRMDEKISTTVPLIAVGDAAGVDKGGVLEQIMHEVEVECLPGNMPERIEFDVSHLEIDDVVTVSQLAMPDGVELLYSDADQPVFSCAMPRMDIEEDEGADADASLEPELVGKEGEDDATEDNKG